MKYKLLTKEQIIISLDRLTRFKNTKEKYLRVFSDVISIAMLEPQMRKSEILNLDIKELTKIAENIINDSIKSILENATIKNSGIINERLKSYENSVFINNSDTQMLLDNNICYESALKLLPENYPINLKWLSYLENDSDLIKMREMYALKYPIEKIILAEGITEEILLPAFSRYLGFDFYNKGINIIAAGGKNQVVKMYYKLIEELKLPIFILLDKDAEDNIKQITPKLRKIDKIHLVSCGEFEDLLPKSLVVKTVNKHFENFLAITENDLKSDVPTAKVLEELFKTKGLHEFKKAEFAKLVRENIKSDTDISKEIRNIVHELNC